MLVDRGDALSLSILVLFSSLSPPSSSDDGDVPVARICDWLRSLDITVGFKWGRMRRRS
jgi:hypothetical protein